MPDQITQRAIVATNRLGILLAADQPLMSAAALAALDARTRRRVETALDRLRADWHDISTLPAIIHAAQQDEAGLASPSLEGSRGSGHSDPTAARAGRPDPIANQRRAATVALEDCAEAAAEALEALRGRKGVMMADALASASRASKTAYNVRWRLSCEKVNPKTGKPVRVRSCDGCSSEAPKPKLGMCIPCYSAWRRVMDTGVTLESWLVDRRKVAA